MTLTNNYQSFSMRSRGLMKIITAFLVALVCAGIVSAQNGEHNTFTFNHLSLSVKDAERSANFYKSVLGLAEIPLPPGGTGKTRWLSLGEGKELHLVSLLKDQDVKINKAVHLALTTPNFEAVLKSLDQSNVIYSDWEGATPRKINIRQDGIKQIYFQDPDGYWIEVNSVAEKSKRSAVQLNRPSKKDSIKLK